jgi:hypothetical protein
MMVKKKLKVVSNINLQNISKTGLLKVVGVINGKDFGKQKDAAIVDNFDCNEGDIKSTTNPTEANLFKAKSQVYNKTATYYNI